MLTAVLLAGCVPKMYTARQENALVEACLPAIKEFLGNRYGEYELGEFKLLQGLIEPENSLRGHFGSNVVKGSYTVGGITRNLVYDKETGEIYTDELVEKLMKQEEGRILEYLKKELPAEDLRDFRVTVLDLSFMVMSHDIDVDRKNTKGDTYVYIDDVLPAGLKEEDLPAFAERDFDGIEVTHVYCHYYSDRPDVLTKEAFKDFIDDNPAYQEKLYISIKNDNPSLTEPTGKE